MYNRDVKLIQDHVLKTGPEGIVDVFTAVIATIRTPFYRIVHITNDIKKNKQSSKQLWGHKKDSYTDVVKRKEELYELFESSAPEKLLYKEVLKIKGLGLAKAGFALQMLGYNVACLDTHNLKRLGYGSSHFNRKDRLEEYLEVVKKEGAEYWWDTWCNLIPQTSGKNRDFKDADEVSYTHTIAVRGY
jgi:hypothetical protein